ncbi:site-2 protease family protein [Methanocaldococcus sp.]
MKYILLIFVIIWVILYAIREKINLKVYYGVAGVLKTKIGLKLIDRLGKYKFWRKLGYISIPICTILGIFMLYSLIVTSVNLASGSIPKDEAKPVIFLFGSLIPWIPGLIGLIIAITVHELAHGIFARSFNLKVKSTGLILFLGIPLGAFVEIEDRFKEVDKKVRGAIASAGPMANLTIYLLCLILMFGCQYFPVELKVVKALKDNGFKEGDIILMIDNKKINSLADFKSVIEPNKVYHVKVLRDNRVLDLKIKTNSEGKFGILVQPIGFALTILNILYWTSWFNFLLALFNLIPAKPLDGYHVLMALPEVVKDRFYKLGVMLEKIINERTINTITLLVWWIIIGAIIYSMW